MNQVSVSIIIPVYNAENFLSACLDSVHAQSFSNWECILVNDGSKDSSLSICRQYEKKDARFFVVDKINGGVSSARNDGLRHANGDWIFFADSDDFLEPDCLETLVSKVNDSIDFVMAGFSIMDEEGNVLYEPSEILEAKIGIEESVKKLLQSTGYCYQGYLWCKLFRSSIVKNNDLQFDSSITFKEDGLFILSYLSKCNGCASFTTKSVYRYVDRASGAMGSLKKGYNPKLISDLAASVKMYDIVKTSFLQKNLIDLILNICVKSYYWNLELMFASFQYDRQSHRTLNLLLSQIGLCKVLNVLPVKGSIKLLLLFYVPRIFFLMKKG